MIKEIMKKKSVIAAIAVVMLSACSTFKKPATIVDNAAPVITADAVTSSSVVVDGVGMGVPASNVVFPAVNKAWLSEGDFVNVENLRKIAPGLTKDELYYLIKPPHFTEGLYGVKKWNYLFNFRTGTGGDYVTCQYQIQFDKNKKVSSTHWKDEACANFLIPPPPVREIIREVPAEGSGNTSSQQFNIAGDVLFNFNKYQLQDMRNQGRAELQKIADIIKGYKSVELIRVIGHTDPLSGMEYNFGLSYKRAQTVKKHLVSLGLDGNVIQLRGAGETELVKTLDECKSGKGKNGQRNVQECLLSNRRVAIEVIGIKN
jgi:OmpA-OmpF porin, OOP family